MKQLSRAYVLFFLLIMAGTFPANLLRAQVTPEAGAMPARPLDLVPTTNSAEARDLFAQALAAADLNETRKARKLYSQAIEKDPEMGVAYLFRAGTANTSKEYIDDINMGKSKLGSASEWEKMYADFLNTNLTGDREKQISIAQSMTEKFPSGRAYVDLGFAYMGNKQYDKAEEAFKKAMEINPQWTGGAGAFTNMYLFGEKKDLTKAHEYASKVVAMAPNSPGAHVILGDSYRAQNDLKKAAEEYQKAINLDPTAPGAYYKLGHANLYLGKMAEARANFKAAGERDDRKMFAEMLQMYTYGYEGNSKKMMKAFLDAADKRMAPATGDAGHAKAEQLELLNAAATAAVHNGDAATLKMIIPRITPLSKEMMSAAGTQEAMLFHAADMLRWEALYDILLGNYTSATDKAHQMKTTLEPLKDVRKNEGYHHVVGFMKLRQKQYKEAIDHLKMGDQLSLYNTYLLAKAYEGLGDKENARKYYKEVASNNFNSLHNALLRTEVTQKAR